MSKSLGNAIGINEPPQEMYGKVMSISDELMWRFYLLLTDLKTDEIEKLRSLHPMQVKKDLARLIVTDFHSAETAKQAAENWEKIFQKGATDADVESVAIPIASVADDGSAIRLDKLLVAAGLAPSRSEAQRKIKEKAVSVDGETVTEFSLAVKTPAEHVIRLGKKMKRAVIQN
jgi:tyrosyl-tRNA synthetase